jgi:uncharacterized protein YbjT (DUF2867 family)
MVARVGVELGTSGTCWHHLKTIMHPRTIELSDRLESPIMHQDPKPQRILVAGGSGFIGKRLIAKLTKSSSSDEIICLTRKPESLHGVLGDSVKVLKGDVSIQSEIEQALQGVDVAFYLVHAMEGDSKRWKKFAERDRLAAKNFTRAASHCGVKRIIYLGGLSHGSDDELSEHMRSRKEVGEILSSGSAQVTIFRAAVILGQGGGSFQMLQYLVERLPVMICPKWVLTKCQPISVDDVVTYLAKAAQIEETAGRTYEIGGPDVLTYFEMMDRYAKLMNKKIRILIIPFLTPRLSSYWVDLVTPVPASLARPLIDSLKHDATVRDHSITNVIPIRTKSFEQSAVTEAMTEKSLVRQNPANLKGNTSMSINAKVLVASLIALGVMGSINYAADRWQNPIHIGDLPLLSGWYFGIATAIYFIGQGARLGALIGGIIGWITLIFWIVEGWSLLLTYEISYIVWFDLLRIFSASTTIIASHNFFHKLRPAKK